MFVQDPNVCLPDQMKASLSITTTNTTTCTSITTTTNTTNTTTIIRRKGCPPAG